jgi:hypothetical protein
MRVGTHHRDIVAVLYALRLPSSWIYAASEQVGRRLELERTVAIRQKSFCRNWKMMVLRKRSASHGRAIFKALGSVGYQNDGGVSNFARAMSNENREPG